MKFKFLITILIFAFCFFAFNNVYGSRIEELKEKIDERKNQASEIEKEIEKYQTEINKTLEEAKTLKNHIKRLNSERKKIVSDIKLTEKEIEITGYNIEKLELQINSKSQEILEKRNFLAEIVRKMNESDSLNLVELILSNNNFSDFFNDIERMENFQEEININLGKLRMLKSLLQNEKAEQESEKENLEALNSRLSDQKRLTEHNKANKSKLLKETRNKESNYKKILEEKIRLKKILEQELLEFEAQLEYELDPTAIPQAGAGVLKWPLDNIYITQRFGLTPDSSRLYGGGIHKGVDFRAGVGTRVTAAGEGVVLGTGNTDPTCPGASFGKWILIKHNVGLAVNYAHLSLIKVSKGDIIKRGQVIGYSGNTGYSTAPHLHVNVYPSNAVEVRTRESKACKGKIYTIPIAPLKAYLDPLLYF